MQMGRGLLFLAAPAVNLVAVMAPQARSGVMMPICDWESQPTLPGTPTCLDIQAQGSEGNGEFYANFVQPAAAQARQANPNVMKLAGISMCCDAHFFGRRSRVNIRL